MPKKDAAAAPPPPSAPTPSVDEKTPPQQPQIIVAPTVVVPVVVPVPVPVPVVLPPSGRGLPAADAGEDGAETASSDFSRERRASLPSPPPPSPPPGVAGKFWRKIGGAGFAVSAAFHFALMVFAVFWVFSEPRVPAESEAAFVSGGGGSVAGAKREFSRRERPVAVEAPKILSRGNAAKIVLPAAPKIFSSRGVSFGGAGRGGDAGAGTADAADASGMLGLGGGLGGGAGIGIGGGKNHLAKFKTLLGTKVKAQRIAVFLDCSKSMKPHLPAVRAEIYEKFPDADVFAFSGAGIEAHDGKILGARTMRAKEIAALPKRKKAEDETDAARLSGQGRTVYKRYAAHFAAGTAGAWLDVFLRERYDALVVFSDFRDGIRQRRDGKTVFADSAYAPAADERDARERRWEEEWLAAFSRKGAPRLYLFSVRSQPQDFLKKCAEVSGGETTVLDLRAGKIRSRGDAGAEP